MSYFFVSGTNSFLIPLHWLLTSNKKEVELDSVLDFLGRTTIALINTEIIQLFNMITHLLLKHIYWTLNKNRF